jgi:cell division protein FtsZ
MSLHEAEQIASSLTYELDPHAKVIWGARVKKEYEGKVRCIAIITGLISDSKVNNSLNNGFIKQLKSISSRGSTNVRVTKSN